MNANNESRWHHVSIGTKLSINNFFLVAIIMTVLIGAISYAISRVIESRAEVELSEKTKLLVDFFGASDKELRARTDGLAKGFQSNLNGKFELGDTMIDINGRPTPALTLDGKIVNLDYLAVDRFTASTASVWTPCEILLIFQ